MFPLYGVFRSGRHYEYGGEPVSPVVNEQESFYALFIRGTNSREPLHRRYPADRVKYAPVEDKDIGIACPRRNLGLFQDLRQRGACGPYIEIRMFFVTNGADGGPFHDDFCTEPATIQEGAQLVQRTGLASLGNAREFQYDWFSCVLPETFGGALGPVLQF
ncbi:MAG: hypothetical protein OXU43_07050 [Gammaproteobacteria bacterium]|nr:hypothetical protein [Gammaproteobacteria bacterium]